MKANEYTKQEQQTIQRIIQRKNILKYGQIIKTQENG